MSKNLKALRDKKASTIAEARQLIEAGKANEGGQMSAEQVTKYDAFMASLKTIDMDIKREEDLAELERSMAPTASVTENTDADKKKITEGDTGVKVGKDLAAERPFKSFGEYLQSVRLAGTPDKFIDPRLSRLNASATGAGETIPSDGGFIVQQDFASEILQRTYDIGAISSRVRRMPISANSNGMVINAVDETSRVNGSRFGGIQAFWEGEGDTPAAKKPKFRKMNLKLNKLIGLMYATDELLQDATAFDSVAREGFAEEVNFLVEDAFWEGNGAGQPLGILAPAYAGSVSIAKETGQAAKTLVPQNIVKMYARLWSRSRANAAWFINQDIEPQLNLMTLPVGTGGVPVYMPPGGLSDSPYATLFGKPVIPVEYASTLGTVGDIVLADWSQYLAIDKGAPQSASSMHVRFIYDEMAFRIVYRCDGQPMWNKPLTPFKGTNTLSPFITLATR